MVDIEFDDKAVETLRLSIMGANRYIFTAFVATIWGAGYAIVCLAYGNIWNAVWIGLIISTFGLAALFSILIDYLEYKFRSNPSNEVKLLRRSLLLIILWILIVLSLWDLIPGSFFLQPLDFVTNNLFFVLLIVPLTEAFIDAIDVARRSDLREFLDSKLNIKGKSRLVFVLITVLLVIVLCGGLIAFLITGIKISDFIQVLLITLALSASYLLAFRSNFRAWVLPINLIDLLFYITSILIGVGFIFRAWSISTGMEDAEAIEIVAISLVVWASILNSANKMRVMPFATPNVIAKYLFGLLALGIGGVVIAVIFQFVTGIGSFSVDTVMLRFYIVHAIAITIALIVSIERRVRRRA